MLPSLIATGEETALDLIQRSDILSAQDLHTLVELRDDIQHSFNNKQVFRTRTEMEVSVLSDMRHPTVDSKYWQAVREQDVMFREVANLSYDYRKNRVEIRELERQVEELGSLRSRLLRAVLGKHQDAEKELLQIEIERKQFNARQQEQVARDRIREIKEWSSIKKELEPKLAFGKIDPGAHQIISLTREYIVNTMHMAENITQPEKRNLLGLLSTSLRRVHELGLVNDLLKPMSGEEQAWVINNFPHVNT